MDIYKFLADKDIGSESVRFKNGDKLTDGGFVMVPNVFIVWGKVSPSMLRTLVGLLVARVLRLKQLRQEDYGALVGQSTSTVSKNLKSLEAIGAVSVKGGAWRESDRYEINADIPLGKKDQSAIVKLTGRMALEFDGADQFTKFGWTKVPLDFALAPEHNDNEFSIGCVILARCYGFGYYDLTQNELGQCIGRKREAIKKPISELSKKKVIRYEDNGKFKRTRYWWLLKQEVVTPPKAGVVQYASLERRGLELPKAMFVDGFDKQRDGVWFMRLKLTDWVAVQAGTLGADGVVSCNDVSDSKISVSREHLEAELWSDMSIFQEAMMLGMQDTELDGEAGTWHRFRFVRR